VPHSNTIPVYASFIGVVYQLGARSPEVLDLPP
jgi:hypothetical protein